LPAAPPEPDPTRATSSQKRKNEDTEAPRECPTRSGKTGTGNPYLKRALGEAAAAAARTDTFLGERYRRLVRRRGKLTALVAIERSILIIVWHLLADPSARYHDLGSDFYARRINKDRRTRTLVHQLEALGHHLTLQPAAPTG